MSQVGLKDGTFIERSELVSAVDQVIASHSELVVESEAVLDGDPAGGDLRGTYPSPTFAVDMATQAELEDVSARIPTHRIYVRADFGAKGDRTTDDTAAIQSAIDALRDMGGGGELVFEPTPNDSYYKITRTLDFSELDDCRITGTGGRRGTNYPNPQTLIVYTGGDAGATNETVINLQDCETVLWDGVSVRADSSAFNGVLMRWDGTASFLAGHNVFGHRTENCTLEVMVGRDPILVSGDACIECVWDGVIFRSAGTEGTQVRGIDSSGDGQFFNANSFNSCTFSQLRAISVLNVGSQISFIDCTFEATLDGDLAPIVMNHPGWPASGLNFSGCGFWDAESATDGVWFSSTVNTYGWGFYSCSFSCAPATGRTGCFDLFNHSGLSIYGSAFGSGGRGSPYIFNPAKPIANGSMLGCDIASAVVDNHSYVFTPESQPTWYADDVIAANQVRNSACDINQNVLVSGQLYLAGGMILPAGERVTSLRVCSGTTAAITPTNQWFCLVDQDLNVLAKTVDDTTTAWAADTVKSLDLAAPYTPTEDIAVYVGIVVVAGTVPSVRGSAASNGRVLSALGPPISGLSTAALTGPASLGATAARPGGGNIPYAEAI